MRCKRVFTFVCCTHTRAIDRLLTFNEAEAMQELELCLQAGDADRGYKQLGACMGAWARIGDAYE